VLLEFEENWEEHTALVEFIYSHQATIGSPIKASLCWEEVGDKKIYGAELIQITTKNIRLDRRTM
jgi:hypothetical protein